MNAMGGQRMPIALKLRQFVAEGIILSFSHPQTGEQFLLPTLNEEIGQAVFFDVQTAHDIWVEQWHNKQLRKGTEYVLQLPYPVTYVEWFDETMEREVGVLVSEANPSWHSKADKTCLYAVVWTLKPSSDLLSMHPIELRMQTRGPQMTLVKVIMQTVADADYGERRKELEGIAHLYSMTVVTALSLINCRNVTTEHLGVVKACRSGTQKRRRIPPVEVRYNTIILPGGGSERHGSGLGAHHRASALHRVRGHFKTFAPERPLLGKHVGTYWWGWQLRGDPELGIVDSDYKLGEIG